MERGAELQVKCSDLLGQVGGTDLLSTGALWRRCVRTGTLLIHISTYIPYLMVRVTQNIRNPTD